MLLLNASKYRIQVTPKKYRRLAAIGFESLLILSVWFWEPHWFPYQVWFQITLSLLIVAHAYQTLRKQLQQPVVASVYQDGRWLFLSKLAGFTIAEPLRLSPRSRCTDWLIWLHFTGGREANWFWIYRDEVSDADYRRLCLAVRYCQRQ